VNIFLTEKGRALRSRLLPHAADVNRIAAKNVTLQDIERIRTVLNTMKENLDRESI
jgi:hypothetical protein